MSMRTELNCWQSCWNFLCCGACDDDFETKQQRSPLLDDRATHGTASSNRPPTTSTERASHQVSHEEKRTVVGLSVQQLEVQTGTHIEKDRKDAPPIGPPNSDRDSRLKSDLQSESGSSPLSQSESFLSAASSPDTLSIRLPHVDTPFVGRQRGRNHRRSDSSESVESSVNGTPVSSPMSKNRSPSKVIDVAAFIHATPHNRGSDSDEND